MTDHEYSCHMLREATENNDGDLIYTKEIPGPEGTTREVDVNVSKLYRPGRRKTGDVELLLIEARLAADGKELGNPAFPINGEIADQFHERLSDDMNPAWIECTPKEFP